MHFKGQLQYKYSIASEQGFYPYLVRTGFVFPDVAVNIAVPKKDARKLLSKLTDVSINNSGSRSFQSISEFISRSDNHENQLIAGTVALISLCSAFTLQISSVKAAGIACPVAIASDVSPTIGCQIGSTNNDTVGGGVLQVNTDSLFGVSDWILQGKDESGGTLNISSEFPGNTISGTWNISSLLPNGWTNALLVFKGGGGNITPDNYVGYLLSSTNTSGTWSTPFTNANNGNAASVSHMSLYYRTGTPIPTPALFPGLIGLGVAALRKRKQAATEV